MIALFTLVLATSAAHGADDAPLGETAPARPARSTQPAAHPDDRMQTHSDNSAAPAAALLEYLGEFNDAADGLDAMGLAEDDASAAGVPRKKERQ